MISALSIIRLLSESNALSYFFPIMSFSLAFFKSDLFSYLYEENTLILVILINVFFRTLSQGLAQFCIFQLILVCLYFHVSSLGHQTRRFMWQLKHLTSSAIVMNTVLHPPPYIPLYFFQKCFLKIFFMFFKI